MEFKEILYAKSDQIARVTINRPKVYNSYSTNTLKELASALDDASEDDSVGVVTITGAGDRAFCTGGDVKEYATIYQRSPRKYWSYMMVFSRALASIKDCSKPVVARINGMAVGGGNEIHLSCDLSIASDQAKFFQVGTRVGSVACGGATQWLPLVIGDRRARWMLYTCDEVDAKTALEWGLVNQVVPAEKLDEAVEALCRKILDKFPECTRYTKAQLNFWKDLVWSQTIPHARDWLALHMAAPETIEGMGSFVEKRPPDHAKFRKMLAEGKSTEYMGGPPFKSCAKCGAKNLPEEFAYCGRCGAKIT